MSHGPYVIRYHGDARPLPVYYRPIARGEPLRQFWTYDPDLARTYASKAEAEAMIARLCSGLTRDDTAAVPLAEVSP